MSIWHKCITFATFFGKTVRLAKFLLGKLILWIKNKNIKENDQKKNESKEKVEAKGTSFKKSTVGKSPNESAEEKVVKKTSTKTKKTTMTTTKKRGRPRKNTKKDVKPLATAGRTKKKDGDSKND